MANLTLTESEATRLLRRVQRHSASNSRLLGIPHLKEDIASQAMINLLNKPSLEGVENLNGYVREIARRAANDIKKKERRHHAVPRDEVHGGGRLLDREEPISRSALMGSPEVAILSQLDADATAAEYIKVLEAMYPDPSHLHAFLLKSLVHLRLGPRSRAAHSMRIPSASRVPQARHRNQRLLRATTSEVANDIVYLFQEAPFRAYSSTPMGPYLGRACAITLYRAWQDHAPGYHAFMTSDSRDLHNDPNNLGLITDHIRREGLLTTAALVPECCFESVSDLLLVHVTGHAGRSRLLTVDCDPYDIIELCLPLVHEAAESHLPALGSALVLCGLLLKLVSDRLLRENIIDRVDQTLSRESPARGLMMFMSIYSSTAPPIQEFSRLSASLRHPFNRPSDRAQTLSVIIPSLLTREDFSSVSLPAMAQTPFIRAFVEESLGDADHLVQAAALNHLLDLPWYQTDGRGILDAVARLHARTHSPLIRELAVAILTDAQHAPTSPTSRPNGGSTPLSMGGP